MQEMTKKIAGRTVVTSHQPDVGEDCGERSHLKLDVEAESENASVVRSGYKGSSGLRRRKINIPLSKSMPRPEKGLRRAGVSR